MEMQQVVEMLAKLLANQNEDRDQMEAIQTKMDSNQVKTDSNQEKAEARMLKFEEKLLDDYRKKRMGMFDAQHKSIMAHQEEMETRNGGEEMETECNPRMMPSAEEHHKIPDREAAVTPVRGLRKWQRVRNLAAKHRQKKQDKTQETCGLLRNFSATRKGMIRCARVTWHRGRIVGKILATNVAKVTQRGHTEEKRCWTGPKCNMGITDPGTQQKLRLQMERISDGFDEKVFGLQFVK
jgi:hypothetical protein